MLDAETAEDLMMPDPVSLPQGATVRDAAALFTDKQISAAPVIDDAGRPVGVLSRTDIVRHVQDTVRAVDEKSEPPPEGTVSGETNEVLIDEIMTPAVLSIPPSASVIEVVAMMLGLGQVHRLFVIDEAGTLVGVISARDVLRKLRKYEMS